MLVISLNKDHSCSIGPHIKVTLVEHRGKHVRIGIDAPRILHVDRFGPAGELLPMPPRPIDADPVEAFLLDLENLSAAFDRWVKKWGDFAAEMNDVQQARFFAAAGKLQMPKTMPAEVR